MGSRVKYTGAFVGRSNGTLTEKIGNATRNFLCLIDYQIASFLLLLPRRIGRFVYSVNGRSKRLLDSLRSVSDPPGSSSGFAPYA